MRDGTKKKIMAVIVVVLLAIVAFCTLYRSDTGNNDPEVDIVGDWYLVSSISFDEDERMYTTVNKNMNISVKGTVEDGRLFYGSVQTDINFQNGTEFTGAFVEKNIIFQYETEYGYVDAIGTTSKGNLVMKEVHYYDKVASPTWFVAVNTYSKEMKSVDSGNTTEPNINLSWTAWKGTSMNETGLYDLAGENFYIHEVDGAFFRAEMEQTVGDDVITKVLNGVFVNSYDLLGTTMYMAYMMDDSGMTWNMYVRDDALILRTATLSELDEINGQPVVVERIYRNSSIAGPPGALSSESDILGTWNVKEQIDLSGDGEVQKITDARSIVYDKRNSENGTLFAGTGVYGEFTGQELTYSVVNKTISSGYMYHTICEYKDFYGAGLDYVSYGYEWMSEDGQTMYRVVFWTDASGENGVTYYEFEKQ